ncbi:hypothetical protein HPB47_024150 [Ixodes persulcatus]|uniref:Uncharacterized protein n=1 Tax=Ixodes persulcatus TaxID=34615 RepID=A0AC60QZH6_IXOPE|nr:hypothetical protein HPB47_024150 [Ixodes persulcatus]
MEEILDKDYFNEEEILSAFHPRHRAKDETILGAISSVIASTPEGTLVVHGEPLEGSSIVELLHYELYNRQPPWMRGAISSLINCHLNLTAFRARHYRPTKRLACDMLTPMVITLTIRKEPMMNGRRDLTDASVTAIMTLSQLGSERHLCAGGRSDNMLVRERLDDCEEENTRWNYVEACAAHRKANNNFFVSALDLLVDLVIFGKFVPYEVDPVVFRVIAHVYESYKGRDKEWESHEQPFVLLSHWSGKVLTKVTASETTDVVEFIADTLKTIKRAM